MRGGSGAATVLVLLLALLRGGRRRREAEEARHVGRRWVVSGRSGSSLLPLLLPAGTAPSSSKGKTLSMPVCVVRCVCEKSFKCATRNERTEMTGSKTASKHAPLRSFFVVPRQSLTPSTTHKSTLPLKYHRHKRRLLMPRRGWRDGGDAAQKTSNNPSLRLPRRRTSSLPPFLAFV